jgi:serine protease inhibitor
MLTNLMIFELNNIFTFKTYSSVKRMLDDHQIALDNLDKVNILESNNVFTLKTHTNVKD